MLNKRLIKIVGIAFLISALEGFIFGIFLYQKNSTLSVIIKWQPSNRFALLIFFISLLLLVIGLSLVLQKKWIIRSIEKWQQIEARRPKIRLFFLFFLGIVFLVITTTLQKIFGLTNKPIQNYVNLFSSWVNLFLFQMLIVVVLNRRDGTHPRFVIHYSIILGVIFLTWLFIFISGIGLIPDIELWNVAGVPVLANQVISILTVALLVDLTISWLEKQKQISAKRSFPWIDLILCIILWVFATVLWIKTPFGNSFFAPSSNLENNAFYPYSDSAVMDLGGQYMLIGKGLNYPLLTEKPLYAFFLGLIHLFSGQNYLTTTSVQIAFFAIFPILMFLLGKKFLNRFFGLFVALFAIIKERNAILSTFKISVSNSRLYLSEFPTSIGMLVLAILLFHWFRNPNKRPQIIVIAGGVLGFSSMIRTNPLVLFPIILLFALIVYHFDWRKWLRSCLLFGMGFLLVFSPWLIYGQITKGTNYVFDKVIAVIERFNNKAIEPNHVTPPLINSDFYIANFMPSNTISGESTVKQEDASASSSSGRIVLGHFFNNEIKALFTLPFQLYPQDLKELTSETYWKEPIQWKGSLPLDGTTAFALNLAIVALGISFSWSKWKYAGLTPLFINFGYYLSDALGRTSGSRYLLPVDWTIYFYYCAGLFFVIQLIFLRKEHLEEQEIILSNDYYSISKRRISPILISCLVLLLLGCSMPLIDASFPVRYADLSKNEIIDKLIPTDFEKATGITTRELSNFVNKNGGIVIYGRELYPRYMDESINNRLGLYVTVINSGLDEIFFAMNSLPSNYISSGDDIIVIGCPKEYYIEGYIAYIFDGKNSIIRSDSFNKIRLSCSPASNK
jgi:hypothetical protein